MPTKSLEEMRDRLYQAFDKAMERNDVIGNYEVSNPEKMNAAANAQDSAMRVSESIVKVEQAIQMRDLVKDLREKGIDVEVDFEKGTVRSISPMNTIKLKPPGT